MPNEYLMHIQKYLADIKPLAPLNTGLKPKVNKDNTIKAIVFDIYGTLIISGSGDLDKSNVTHQGISAAFDEAGISWTNTDYSQDADKLLNLFHNTVINHQNALKAKGHPYPEVDIIAVWEEVISKAVQSKWVSLNNEPDYFALTVVFELLSNAVYPMPNMRETLKKLFNSKLPIGIVSNAQFYTPLLMNYFIHNKISDKEHIDGFNDDISIYSYKLLRSKPDKLLFERLAESFKQNYQLEPHQVVFVGNDMLKDSWTASQVGFKTILFAADKRSLRTREDDERCKNLEPDFIITDLMQLFDIVSL